MVTVDREKCVGCGLCVKDCNQRRLVLREGRAEIKGACFLCGHCVAICPRGAVSIPEYDMADVEEFPASAAALNSDTLLRAIKFRRSVRDFQAREIGRETLERLVQAGRYAPTANNTQGCRLIVVQKELPAFREMIWQGIGRELKGGRSDWALPFKAFYQEHEEDPARDYLFRNAPAVLLIAAEQNIDAALAAANMEMMGVSMGLGFLYDGYLRRAAANIPGVCQWLGADGKAIEACALMGYPEVVYQRTAPRRAADAVFL